MSGIFWEYKELSPTWHDKSAVQEPWASTATHRLACLTFCQGKVRINLLLCYNVAEKGGWKACKTIPG